ncbi:unnamed protein product [Caenorhabditis angaria]|uniref:Uncharacterized protein n=1 Tax=Caenorhabditis angaria TaxID=860376 RepID=A0A9P1I7N9_9PELO|nr:unnamed protein product [Caenorhabditis angaria]
MLKSIGILAFLGGVLAHGQGQIQHNRIRNDQGVVDLEEGSLVSRIQDTKSKGCELGHKRRIGKGSYYEECLPRYETNGCYAGFATPPEFVANGETIDRLYSEKQVGFRYKCEKTADYIYFAPESCFVIREDGKRVHIPMGKSAIGRNSQRVHCKKNSAGEYSFEYGEIAKAGEPDLQ